MISSIELGKNYAIRLSQIYGYIKHNVSIIGVTNIDNVAKNKDAYNIYETFFKPVGLGITTYYTAIQDTTPIYICVPIKSLTPLDVDINEKIFIPKTLIDLSESFEYVEAMNISIEIYPLVKKMIDNEDERNEYLEEITDKVKTRLKSLIDFNNMDVEINPTYESIYLEKEALEKIEAERNEEYVNYLRRLKTARDLDERKEHQFNERYSDLLVSQRAYEEAKRKTEDERVRLTQTIDRYNDLIAGN